MKKYWMILAVAVLSFSLMGCGDPCKENVFSKLGDSLATMGKKGMDKDKILAERAADRAAKCAEKKGGEVKAKLGF